MSVNLSSGAVNIDREDINIPGRIPMLWVRCYSSCNVNNSPGPLGHGWRTRYFCTLEPREGFFQYTNGNGDTWVFNDPDDQIHQGGILRDLGSFQELSYSNGYYILTRWDVDNGDIEREFFKAHEGRQQLTLTHLADVCGECLDLDWDAKGHLTQIRQRREHRSLAFKYNLQGLMESVSFVSAEGQQETIIRYQYNEQQQLCSDTDSLDRSQRYEYDSASQLTKEIAKDQTYTVYRYDRQQRCVKTHGISNYNEKTMQYLDSVFTTKVTDSYGESTIINFRPTGQAIKETDPLGNISVTEYDELGRIVSKTNANGSVINYCYDSNGNRCEITNPLGHSFRFEYNKHHLPVCLTDPNGHQWKRAYDYANRLVTISNPEDQHWKIVYDAQGNAVTIINPLGAELLQRFDDNGVLIAHSDWQGNLTHYKRDSYGRITHAINAQGQQKRLVYDRGGNLVEVTFPNGNKVCYQYNAMGQVTQISNELNHITQFSYGLCGRLHERIDPSGHSMSYVWGTEAERLEQVINENDEAYLFVRDALGRPIKEISFDGREQQFEYDALSRCIAVTDANGDITKREFDESNRLVKITLADGEVLSYKYDPSGNLIEAANDTTTLCFKHDKCGRIVEEIQGDHWVKTFYDAIGNISATETSLGHIVHYQHNANSQLHQLRFANGEKMELNYNKLNREVQRLLPGGQVLNTQYHDNGQIAVKQLFKTPTSLALDISVGDSTAEPECLIERRYFYDAGLRLIAQHDNRGAKAEYKYDANDRLIEALWKDGTEEHFIYDPAGNILDHRHIKNDGKTELQNTCRLTDGNRLIQKGPTQYHYDQEGRLTEKIEHLKDTEQLLIWKYQWNSLGQLRQITTPENQIWLYHYDALGRRIRKQSYDDVVNYLWDKDILVQVWCNNGPNQAWIMDPNGFQPLALLQDNEVYSVIADPIGTPRELISQHGYIVWRADYSAYGKRLDSDTAEGVNCQLRFPGQCYDPESQLHYNYFRYYDPNNGRYISQDPKGLRGSDNFYLYGINPINWIDPFGLICTNYKGQDGQGYVIYHITDGGDPAAVLYVGITERGRIEQRIQEHTRSGRLSGQRQMDIVDSAENYGQARGYEQAHMEQMGTVRSADRGQPLDTHPGNRQRSYDPARLNGTPGSSSRTRAETFDKHYRERMGLPASSP